MKSAKSALLCGGLSLAALLMSSNAQAETMTFTLSESDTQPQFLPFNAVAGTVLLCDSTGATKSVPLKKGATWGCYSNAGNTGKLVEASDLITFAANPGDKLFPSQATFCSDVDFVPDPGDADPACKGTNLVITANFALQELGPERVGPEMTPYSPADKNSPGFGMVPAGSKTLLATYQLISDPATKMPEPSAFAILAAGLLGLLGGRWRGALSRD